MFTILDIFRHMCNELISVLSFVIKRRSFLNLHNTNIFHKEQSIDDLENQ